ncbi:hypothetical protein Tco_1059086 [Tanacetum coccineum]
MKSQLSDYDIHYKIVSIFYDNTSAIAISNNHILHSRTKHIDIRYHFIRDHILKGDIELHFISTEYQLADIFTNPLDEPTFTRLKAKLGMLNINEFWCTVLVDHPTPPTGDSEARPLKESNIKFIVKNGKTPLLLDYRTFCQTTCLEYNNGNYVLHPSTEEVQAKLTNIFAHEPVAKSIISYGLKDPDDFCHLGPRWEPLIYRTVEFQSTVYSL